MRKIPFAGIELTSQRVRGLRGTSELPGRPAIMGMIIDLYVLDFVLHELMSLEPREINNLQYKSHFPF